MPEVNQPPRMPLVLMLLEAKDVLVPASRRRVAPAERVRLPMLKNTEPLPVPAASVRVLLALAKLMPARVWVL